MCSASFKSGAATAGITVLLGLILTSITAVDAKWQMFNPAYLSKNAVYFLSEGKGLDYFGVCFGFTILLIIGLFFATYFVMKKKPLQAENH
ncbi:hypothetical protein [Listeria floridensis]|uniref:hypothetical protein n=1 Tax=Listeria floridensis TaxID=1494962 RepID=UPI0004ACF12B|nr:hypothetical protein [Listeria floridensis]